MEALAYQLPIRYNAGERYQNKDFLIRDEDGRNTAKETSKE